MLRVAIVMALFIGASLPAQESAGVTAEEAVKLAFPGCQVARSEHALSKAQQQVVKKRAAVCAVPSRVVRFVAKKEATVQGFAYLDTRRVRSQPQTLLVIVDAAAKVKRIEVLVWKEPRRYRPKPKFWAQFQGKGLDGALRLRRGVRPVTGATMSARAAVDAVRTVLAVHECVSGVQLGPAR